MVPSWLNEKPVINKMSGDRLNLRHGPINIVLRVWGGADVSRQAQRLVFRNFPKILPALFEDVEALKAPAGPKVGKWSSPTAQRMAEAASLFSDAFITPMCALSSAVAEEVLRIVVASGDVARAFVSNGGDVAFHLTDGQSLACGPQGDFSLSSVAKLPGELTFAAGDGVAGIAGAGVLGRGLTLGIADYVTVFAATASRAECAATLVANAVNVDSALIKRAPAKKIEADSDLGARPVTTSVGKLAAAEIARALHGGVGVAQAFLNSGRIAGAVLRLQGEQRVVGVVPYRA